MIDLLSALFYVMYFQLSTEIKNNRYKIDHQCVKGKTVHCSGYIVQMRIKCNAINNFEQVILIIFDSK